LRAVIRAFRAGSELPGSSEPARNADRVDILPNGGTRAVLDNSLYFRTARNWTCPQPAAASDSVTFRVELTWLNGDTSMKAQIEQTATFYYAAGASALTTAVPELHLVPTPIHLHPGGDATKPAVAFDTTRAEQDAFARMA